MSSFRVKSQKINFNMDNDDTFTPSILNDQYQPSILKQQSHSINLPSIPSIPTFNSFMNSSLNSSMTTDMNNTPSDSGVGNSSNSGVGVNGGVNGGMSSNNSGNNSMNTVTGPRGYEGAIGQRGEMGFKGERGDRGEKGERGENGRTQLCWYGKHSLVNSPHVFSFILCQGERLEKLLVSFLGYGTVSCKVGDMIEDMFLLSEDGNSIITLVNRNMSCMNENTVVTLTCMTDDDITVECLSIHKC
jgi:hypothetical protein